LNTAQIPGAVAPELALALFRIAQEALNNIGKHARATEIEVNLSRKGRELLLSVSDNGIGFVPGGGKPPSERGIGLGSMRERAEAVGGFADLRSSPGAGTKLVVNVPLLTSGGSTR
jgi:signal transduction histidine kinase